MKKTLTLFAGAALLSTLAVGCASTEPQGCLSIDVKLPSSNTSVATSTKKGVASCESWFGMVAIGDASVNKAVKDGKITKINYVDKSIKSEIPLGIKTVYTTTVYGE